MSKKTFNRLRKYETVDINSIDVDPNFQYDAVFGELYQAFELGRRITSRTRLSRNLIIPGTPQTQNGAETRFIQNTANTAHVSMIAQSIRSGSRPTLLLYSADSLGFDGKYVCCDDVVTFSAYVELGIEMIPVHILNGRLSGVEEGYYKIKGPTFKTMNWGRPAIENIQAIFPLDYVDSADDASNAIRHFSNLCKIVGDWVEEFGIDNNNQESVDYHRTLHSVTYRLREMADATLLLLSQGMSFQILGIIRSAYELSLNFYVDWLAPESIGPLLQAVASSYIPGDLKASKERSASLKRELGSAIALAEIVKERASISPLGSKFYEGPYAYLSKASHQDFSMTEAYGDTIYSRDQPGLDTRMLGYVTIWMDAIYTSTLTRLADDVGKRAEFQRAAMTGSV